MFRSLHNLLEDREALVHRIEKFAINTNTRRFNEKEFNEKEFNELCEYIGQLLSLQEFTFALTTSSVGAKKILSNGKKLPWVNFMRNVHTSALNFVLALSDDTTVDENGERLGGALTDNLQSQFCDLLGVYSNETILGRRFLGGEISGRYASIANYGNKPIVSSYHPSPTLTKPKLAASSEGYIILKYPQDDL